MSDTTYRVTLVLSIATLLVCGVTMYFNVMTIIAQREADEARQEWIKAQESLRQLPRYKAPRGAFR